MPVKITWTVSSVNYEYTIYASEMAIEQKSKKIRQPIPDGDDIIVNLGREGPDIRLSFLAPTAGDYDNYLSHLYAAASVVISTTAVTNPYPEFPHNSIWYVEKISFKRMPGFINQRLVDITLNRWWSGY